MRKKSRIILISLICAGILLAAAFVLINRPEEKTPVTAANASNFGVLLGDLVNAYEEPGADRDQSIKSDLDAIRKVSRKDAVLAQSVADNWREVFLDPDYRLYLYQGNKTAPELAGAGIPNRRSHAIVVLGYELMNGRMQPELTGRCEAAAAVARAFPETILVCSGGATGRNNPESNTEAGLMKAWLTEQGGIDASRIYTDERAMTTAENAVNTFRILQENSVHTMTIVTSTYHMRWGQAVYHVLAELYRRQQNYSIESIGNYCFDIEPAVEAYRTGDRIAASQIAGILELPAEATRAMSSRFPKKTTGGMPES